MTTAPQLKRQRNVFIAIMGILVIGFVALMFRSCAWVVDAGSSSADRSDALVECHAAVRAQLKAPDSATFDSENVSNTGTTWNVSGVVRSTNSFGGTVPATYTCTATGDADTMTARATIIE